MDERLHIDLPAGAAALAGALVDGGRDAVLVGGAVRDTLLGREVCDLDLVTDAPPATVRDIAALTPGVRGVYAVGERFGTLGVSLAGGGTVEVSAYRPDAASKATTHERFAADALHRDFTIDAMGVSLADGRLLDPLQGREDLADALLRAPGDPAARFAEDPLRVLRGPRLVAQLGFRIERGTAEAMRAAAPLLAGIAPERMRVELTKLLTGPHAADGLQALRTSGSLAVVMPELDALAGLTQPSFHDLDVWKHTVQTVQSAPPTPVARWAALLHDVGKGRTRTVDADGRIRFLNHAKEGALIAEAICERLRFSNDERRAVVHLVAEHMRLGEVNPDNPRSVDRAVRRLDLHRGETPLATAEDALALTMADFSATAHRGETDAVGARLVRALAESRARGSARPVVSPVGGAELMRSLGIEQGPAVGAAKRAIEEAVADGRITPGDRDGALAVARAMIGETTR